MEKNPLANFTLPARVVIVVGLFLAAGGTCAYIGWLYDGLPQGSYPLFFFVMPVLLVVGVVVGLGLLALRLMGIPVYRGLPPDQDTPSGEEPLDPPVDDRLTDELLEANPKLQALVAKSKASPRRPFSAGQQGPTND